MSRAIYIVDDDDAVRDSLASLLPLRFEARIASFVSGVDFIAALPKLDQGVVLLDQQMPGATGLEVLEALAPMRSRFAAIMITGQGDVPLAVRALKAGAIDFLEKPFDATQLHGVIESGFAHIERRRAADSARDEARAALGRLSPREQDVLRGLLRGGSNKVIGYQLDLSPRTVEIHRAKLMEKLNAPSLSEVLRIAFTAQVADYFA